MTRVTAAVPSAGGQPPPGERPARRGSGREPARPAGPGPRESTAAPARSPQPSLGVASGAPHFGLSNLSGMGGGGAHGDSPPGPAVSAEPCPGSVWPPRAPLRPPAAFPSARRGDRVGWRRSARGRARHVAAAARAAVPLKRWNHRQAGDHAPDRGWSALRPGGGGPPLAVPGRTRPHRTLPLPLPSGRRAPGPGDTELSESARRLRVISPPGCRVSPPLLR